VSLELDNIYSDFTTKGGQMRARSYRRVMKLLVDLAYETVVRKVK